MQSPCPGKKLLLGPDCALFPLGFSSTGCLVDFLNCPRLPEPPSGGSGLSLPNLSLSPCLCPGSPPGGGGSLMGRHQVGGGLCWGCGHQWGTALQGLAMGFPAGRQRGGPQEGCQPMVTPHLGKPHLPLTGSSIPPCPWGSESFPWVPGNRSGGTEFSINLISASCSPHP